MNRSRPTIAELRSCVQKDRHREIGNCLARRFARPTAVYGCWLATPARPFRPPGHPRCTRRVAGGRDRDRHGRARLVSSPV